MRGRAAVVFTVALLIPPLPAGLRGATPTSVVAVAVESVGMTVSNRIRAIDFYTSVLTFEKIFDRELSGREYELLTGIFGARLGSWGCALEVKSSS